MYPMIFETPADPAGERLLGRNEGLPNPFVLAPGWAGARLLRPGDEVGLEVTLVGRAMAEAELVFTSLAAAARRGIGPDRVPLTLLERQRLAVDTSSPMPPCLRLTFTTPLRLVEKGVLIIPASFRPHHLLGALVRRISLLAQYHHVGTPELDFQELKRRAAAASFVGTDLIWRDWSRRSARQRTVIRMGGLMGIAVLPMAGLEPFWPLLRLAPALHVGKGTTMGLGAITLTPAA